MANVKTVQDRSNGALLIMDDGVKVWTPDKELARTLLGKPIPPDWTRRDNENGPMALPPKPRGAGGMTAWRNTKEGFEAEAAGRRRWQEVEEEKKDRRTALMQAMQYGDEEMVLDDLLSVADRMYRWLRSSPAAGPAAIQAGMMAGAATTEERPRTPPQAGAPTSGSEAGGGLQPTAQDPGPDPSSVIGEEAGEEPGVGSVKTTPGSTTYPMSQAECDHRAKGGYWLKTQQSEGVPICPRCGMSAILYKESA